MLAGKFQFLFSPEKPESEKPPLEPSYWHDL